jgi:hypothetical protein
MSNSDVYIDTDSAAQDTHVDDSFLANILTPGSSLHPTFLLIVDVSLATLVLILLSLLALTRSLHFVALVLITLALWASIKWCAILSWHNAVWCSLFAIRFVSELRVVESAEISKKHA